MRWISLITVIVASAGIVTGCTEGDNSHREYIITQSHIDEEFANSFINLSE
jgi:hypothetical protein